MKTYYWLLIFITVSCSDGRNPRTINFPGTREKVQKMPQADSLWLFIMAGQSNMAGRGFVEPLDTIADRKILALDAFDQWVYAKEPLHFYEPDLTGLDCGLSFARTLLDSLPMGVSIGMIPCAVGGSSIEQWLNDETFRSVTLLSNFKNKVDLAQNVGTIKGILWHQGESNAKSQLIPEYGHKLKQLSTTFRTLVKNDSLPILIGQLGSYAWPPDKRARWNAINSKIEDVARSDRNVYVIYTQDLQHKGDKVHFDSKSQRLMGRRFAMKYLELLKPK